MSAPHTLTLLAEDGQGNTAQDSIEIHLAETTGPQECVVGGKLPDGGIPATDGGTTPSSDGGVSDGDGSTSEAGATSSGCGCHLSAGRCSPVLPVVFFLAAALLVGGWRRKKSGDALAAT